MIYFLTSSPCVQGAPELNPANGFVDELKNVLELPCKALFITAEPDDYHWTETVFDSTRKSFEHVGFSFQCFRILDRRNEKQAAKLIQEADLIILAGGHVPTEHQFFMQLQLRELLDGYTGVIVGISAGTMNSAEIVYAQPEREGESVSKEYQRFLPGLGITKTMVLPHYQLTKHDVLDGKRLYEDITYPDSMNRRFYALVDGSYIFGHDGIEELRGEAYLIKDGTMRRISSEGDILYI